MDKNLVCLKLLAHEQLNSDWLN